MIRDIDLSREEEKEKQIVLNFDLGTKQLGNIESVIYAQIRDGIYELLEGYWDLTGKFSIEVKVEVPKHSLAKEPQGVAKDLVHGEELIPGGKFMKGLGS